MPASPGPASVTEADRIAVVGVANTGDDSAWQAARLAAEAAVIEQLTGASTVAVLVDADLELVDALRRLPRHIAAIYLTHTPPHHARAVQHHPGLLDRPVLTEEQTLAVVAVADAVLYLHRLGRRDPH